MIDLSAYPKFKQGIESKQTSIYPIIRIDETLHISTVKESIDGVQYFDYGLSVTNIKESIDIVNRSFKISNVSLSLNNYPDNEDRLSDTVYNYINKYVEIFYKSQFCNALSDCLPVYKGLLKGIKYNDKSITLTLEDLTEKTLHKDVPIANLGYSENVYSKEYKNREIPITYGMVDKAPAVIYRDGKSSEGRIHVISDNVFGINNPAVEIKGFEVEEESLEENEMGNIESPFYIYKDNYFRVLQDASTVQDSIGSEFEEQDQFRISLDNNSIYIDKKYNLSVPVNPPSDNYLECVRVAFPNDIKILKPEEGETFTSEEGHTIALINPTNNSLDSIIDNPFSQNELIINEENFLSTAGQIPNNEITLDNTTDFDNYIVHEFTPHRNGDYKRNRLWYPSDGGGLSTIFNTVAWCWSAAHLINVKFIELPTADLIKQKIEEHLSSNNIDLTLKTGRSHFFRPQTRFSETRAPWEQVNNRDIHEYVYTYDNAGNITSTEELYTDATSEGLSGATYPTSIYKFITNEGEHYENVIWVGQWSSVAMIDDSWLDNNSIFLNIFPDVEHPALFENMDEFAIFAPINKVHESISKSRVYGMKYRSNWNGTPIGNLTSSLGSDCIYSEKWMPGEWGYEDIWADWMCKSNQSWCLYFPEGVDGNEVMAESVTSDDRPYGSINTTIKPKTFIPCNHYQLYESHSSGYTAGYDFWYDYAIPDNPNAFTLGSGSSSTTGEKLIISMPFSDLSASDAVEGSVRTFPYGKLNCVFNPSELDTPNTVSGDEFSVMLSGSTIDDETDEYYSLNFTEDSDYGAKLITLQGGSALNTHDDSGVVWSTVSEEDANHFSWDESQGQIIAWDSPDAMDSIALSFSLTGDSVTHVSLETNITAIGIMQFITFENALSDNLYLDTSGRANSVNDIEIENPTGAEAIYYFRYTDEIFTENSIKDLIESPADIMYHFVEKELGQANITDRDSWREARQNTELNLAFSVKEKINSKELFKKISTNCNLIPRFRQNGEFAFTSIKSEYNSSDLTIMSNDILSFELGYTPASNIYTLVNVKYKMDYESEEFTKQTGYCDGYDFFGDIEGGYDYGYYGLKRDENILEFESEFIRDVYSAKKLRDFIYMYHCNHHAIAKVSLPLKYSNLELGDIVQFDKIVNNIKSLGEDYTSNDVTRNGQKIYPYFMVTSITKSPKQIKIEATQLHKLVRSFTPGIGSLSRKSELGINDESTIDISDYNILYDIVLREESNQSKYITSEQKRVSDITGNGSISLNDLNAIGQILGIEDVVSSEEFTDGTVGDAEFNLGDINQDGSINVVDIINMVNLIMGTNSE